MSTMPASSSHGTHAGARARRAPRAAGRAKGTTPPAAGLELRWRLPACGLSAATLPPEVTYKGGDLWVSVRLEPRDDAGAWCVRARLEGAAGDGPALWASPCRAAEVCVQGDLLHVDAPGLLVATLRDNAQGGWRVLYAQTAALAALGVPGGRAEFEGPRAE